MLHNRRALPGERRKTVPRPGQTEPSPLLKREDGIAMLTVLMLTLILTVIGVAAITSTTVDIKRAGGERVRESTVNAAEACMSSGVQIIQQTLANGAVPSTLTGVGANPSITLPVAWDKPLVTSQACMPACPRASRASGRSREGSWGSPA